MLTTSDLQAIKKLVQDESKVIRSDFSQELGEIKKLIQDEGQVIRKDVSADTDKKLKSIKSDIRQIKSDISVMVKSFNREDMNLRKRVVRVEKHLGLPPME